MNDPLPPSLPPQLPVVRRRGLGCFAKGCLLTVTVLMLLGVGVGAFGWYFYKSSLAYLTPQQIPTRISDATDEQYQAVLAKLQPFGQAMNDGRAATLGLTADDLNTLVARAPQLAPLRGQVFVDIVGGQLIADLSFPIAEADSPGPHFVSAHTTLDASFAGGRFTFALRHATPLRGEANEGLLPSMLRNPAFLQTYSEKITGDFNVRFREMARNNPPMADLLAKLRTVVIQDNQVVATSVERPELPSPEPSPDVSPVATPAKTE